MPPLLGILTPDIGYLSALSASLPVGEGGTPASYSSEGEDEDDEESW